MSSGKVEVTVESPISEDDAPIFVYGSSSYIRMPDTTGLSDGVYTLQLTLESGQPTLQWVS